MKIKTDNKLNVQGISRLRAWPKGLLPGLMAQGMSLNQAMEAARPVADMLARNLVVTTGKSLAAKVLSGQTLVSLTYHAIGTGTSTPVAGNTALGAEVARKQYTSRSAVGAVASFSVFYLASECTYNIKECGWFGDVSASNTPGSGTLFSRWLQSFDNSAGLYDLTFDYSVTLS